MGQRLGFSTELTLWWGQLLPPEQVDIMGKHVCHCVQGILETPLRVIRGGCGPVPGRVALVLSCTVSPCIGRLVVRDSLATVS